MVYEKNNINIKLYNDDENSPFWKIEDYSGKIVIMLNINHAFYKDYIQSFSTEGQLKMYCLLSSLAYAQLETYKYNTDNTLIDMWDEIWYSVSKMVKKLS